MSTLTQIAADFGVEPDRLASLLDIDTVAPDAELSTELAEGITYVAEWWLNVPVSSASNRGGRHHR